MVMKNSSIAVWAFLNLWLTHKGYTTKKLVQFKKQKIKTLNVHRTNEIKKERNLKY